MNVFYFVKRFPRRYKTANEQKIFSMTQTFLNQGYKIHLVSADLSSPQEYEHLKKYPINMVPVSSKRISASLSAAQVKPDIAVFNSFEMQEMYSAYMYNKWNKCPRILEINQAVGLQRWRKSKYSVNTKQFFMPYDDPLYEKNNIFLQSQKKSIIRSDLLITPNDFLYHLTKTHIEDKQRVAILSHGYPMKEFYSQVKNQEYRPFQNRKNFICMADLSREHSAVTLHFLVRDVWSKIKKQLPDAQLHIYSSGYWKKAPTKQELEKFGIFFKGYVEDVDIIQKYKVMLYPAQHSVGLKSKVIESWLHHTPVVTTPVGAEGMFFEALEARYTVAQSQHDSGFINERQYTNEEIEGEKKLNQYYRANSLSSKNSLGLNFGGSFRNYSFDEFARSAIELYTNQQKWKQCLKIGQKTLLKNQSQIQLEINLKLVTSRLQMTSYKTRGEKAYEEEWKRFIKSKEYEKKVHQYP